MANGVAACQVKKKKKNIYVVQEVFPNTDLVLLPAYGAIWRSPTVFNTLFMAKKSDKEGNLVLLVRL